MSNQKGDATILVEADAGHPSASAAPPAGVDDDSDPDFDDLDGSYDRAPWLNFR
jgi:hypothetical protein